MWEILKSLADAIADLGHGVSLAERIVYWAALVAAAAAIALALLGLAEHIADVSDAHGERGRLCRLRQPARHAPVHQARDEVNVPRQSVEFGDNQSRAAQSAGGERGGHLRPMALRRRRLALPRVELIG
jgi:hypothetical protein